MESADQTGKRIYATIPFEKKDVLKERGYRWNNGADGRPRSWYIDLEADQCDAETNYLKREILGERGSLSIVERSAENRFTLPG